MGINIKGPGKGDLTGTSKKEKEARTKAFTPKQNAVVASRISQSENGFKGESKNEYGLPNGVQQVQTHVGPEYTGPKDRKIGAPMDKVGADKYADGVNGVKIKPKINVSTDATRVKPFTNLRAVTDNYANKISKMNDKELFTDAVSQDIKGDKLKNEQATDSLASRNIKKRGGYRDGTKGIKMKKKDA